MNKKTESSNKRNAKLRENGGKQVLYSLNSERLAKMAAIRQAVEGVDSHQRALDYCVDYVHAIVVDKTAP